MPRRNHSNRRPGPRRLRRMEAAQVPANPSLRCHACGKIAADSESHAWKLAEAYHARNGGEMPNHVYPCEYSDNWHWTRNPIVDVDTAAQTIRFR